MVQLVDDRHHHEHRPVWQLLLQETLEAVRAAPRMRWESPVSRTVILAVAATAAAAAALVAQVLLLPLGLAVLVAWHVWGKRLPPVAPASASRRWTTWLIAAALAIAVAVAIPAVDGGELNELWWTVMAIALLAGVGMAVTGLILAVSDRAHRMV
jgi:hypothetical protein